MIRLTEEDYAQITVSDFCLAKKIPFYHFPSEGKRSLVYGKILKRKGCKRGVADCFMPRPSHGHAGLWLELKIHPSKATKEQIQFLEDRRAENYEALLVIGKDSIDLANQAIQHICDFYDL